MSFSLLSRRFVLAGMVSLSGCGFVPAYGTGGAAERWQNTVAIDAPDTAFGFQMAGRLTRVLGPVDTQQYRLSVSPRVEPVPATITEDGDITRFNLTGNAEWSLTDRQGRVVNDGLVQTFTSHSATGSTVATQSAESDARDRLAVALADLIIQQMLTTP